MIKIIFIDIEGTLTPGKYKNLDLVWLKKILDLSYEAEKQGVLLTISTGRPQPYVESMLQAINGKTWAVCENGAVFYNPSSDISVFNPNIPKNFTMTKIEIEQILREHLDKDFPGWRKELGKEFILSLCPPLGGDIEKFYREILNILNNYKDLLEITHSKSAVDIAPRGISKMDGIKWIIEQLNIKQEETAGIGDSLNDLEMLEFVGFPGVPINADPKMKEVTKKRRGFISEHPHTHGTYDFIMKCLEKNSQK